MVYVWCAAPYPSEMEMFRGDHGLVIDVCAVQERRKSVVRRCRLTPV